MLIRSKKITIVKISKPIERDLNHELQWFGDSLGLFNLRDKDKSCFRIFIELLKSAKKREPLTSDEIAERLNLSRGTVIHHINKLMEAGIVIHHKNRYMLRVDNLASLIDELHRDIKRTCINLKEIAFDIDKAMGL
ncbi:winged helix-turn-helix domain-containing protein [Candidatus Woesearchaeota archaeon]|nr:winged helix-turn-helix domain-containing protein [Candidatus Woesearchaeota archaeon]